MTPNQSERLARIEILLDRLLADVEKLSTAHANLITVQALDKEDLAALKNKGAGILIGVGIVAGVVGAHIQDILKVIGAAFAGH